MRGAIAQLGERYNGIVEVSGSIPLGSTTWPSVSTGGASTHHLVNRGFVMLQPTESPQETKVWGAERLFKTFAANLKAPSFWPAWLITGPQGVGKRTLLEALGCQVLSITDRVTLHDVLSNVRQASDPSNGGSRDTVALGALSPCLYALRAPRTAEVRKLHAFLGLHPLRVEDKRLVVLLDVDAMGGEAQNALLKLLEEPPPQTLFLATAKTMAPVLMTLRSRLRPMPLKPLGWAEFRAALRTVSHPQKSEPLSDEALRLLFGQTFGCVGSALTAWEQEVLGAPAGEGSATENTSALMCFHTLLKRGLLPAAHPDFLSPFAPHYRTFWEEAEELWLHTTFQAWCARVVTTFWSTERTSLSAEEQAVADRLSPEAWWQFLVRVQTTFEDAQTYHLQRFTWIPALFSLPSTSAY